MEQAEHVVAQWQAAGPKHLDLGAEAIHVWRIPIDGAQPSDLVASRHDLLSSDEIERAARFHFESHRNQYILCRGAIRILLGRYMECPPHEIAFSYERHGKPVLCGNGDAGPTQDLAFNVSHSGEFALAGITLDHRIGIDIEKVRALPDADRLVGRFFSEAERAEFRALPPAARPAAFFNCWTRKEAFIKAVGEGLSRPLHSFDVSLTPGKPARLLRVAQHPGEEKRWFLSSFEPAPGYTAAVIAETKSVPVSFYDFR